MTNRPEIRTTGNRHIIPAKLGAGVNAQIGDILVPVAGYYVFPAAGNAATAGRPGIVTTPADNTAGLDGAATAYIRLGEVYDFTNSGGGNAVTIADVGQTVYATTRLGAISNASADGPPLGVLEEFAPTEITYSPARPCRVKLPL